MLSKLKSEYGKGVKIVAHFFTIMREKIFLNVCQVTSTNAYENYSNNIAQENSENLLSHLQTIDKE